ncbi:MAG: choice-of-anchor D domain-containing protein [Terriglobia bacterium]
MSTSTYRLGNPGENQGASWHAKLALFAFLFSLCFSAATAAMAASSGATSVQAAGNKVPGTAPSLSFANSTVAGNLIMVGIDFDGTASPSSVSDMQGNTFVQVASQLTSPEGTGSRVYYAKNIKGGADTVTVHWSVASANVEIYLTEYAGLDLNNPVDAQAGATGSAGAVSSGLATTTVSGDIIYGYCVGDSACTVGSGFSARSTYDQNLIEDMTAGSPGSYAATASASNGWTMQMVALKLASSGAPAGTAAAPVTSGPAAGISATSLTFASQAIGVASAAQTITVINIGSADLNIAAIAVTGANASDFAEVNTCLLPIVAGGSCNIVILFTPSAVGTRTASLTITDNASGSPQSVSLSGTGGHDVVLTWTTIADPTYNVYRGTAPGGESSTPLNSSPIGGSTFTDDSVTPGATYYYVVRAVTANGAPTGATSNEASATVP